LEWNIHGFNTLYKLDDDQWKKIYECEIIGLVETWHTTKIKEHKLFKDFIVFESQATKQKSKGRASGGLIMLINKNLQYDKIKMIECTNFYILIELIIYNVSHVIGCFYISPVLDDKICNEILEETLTQLTEYKNSRIIIIGDFNSRIGNLNQIHENTLDINNINLTEKRQTYDETINNRGTLMNETFEFFGYLVLNGRTKGDTPAKYTYVGENGRSIVDLAWANEIAQTTTTNFQVLHTGCISDHFPIMLQMNVPQKPKQQNNHQKLQKLTKLKWDSSKSQQYQSAIMRALSSSETELSLREALKLIKDTAKLLGMEKTFTVRNNAQCPAVSRNPWFNKDCRAMKKTLRRAAKDLKKHQNDIDTLYEYKESRKKYLCLINECKKNYENEIKMKLSNIKNNTVFWKTIKEIKQPREIKDVISISTWQNYLNSTQNPQMSQIHSPHRTVIVDEYLDKPIEDGEIYLVLQKLKNNKSPGCDGITNEFLKNLPYEGILAIKKELNLILETGEWHDGWNNSDVKMLYKKGTPEDPGNYRPIALENSTFKLLTNIISNRLSNWAEMKKVIPDYQNGFRPKRGCIDNIFIINTLIETAFKNNKALFAVFIDLKGAFDNVKHGRLWKHLEANRVSTKMTSFLRKIYETTKIRIVTPAGYTELINLIQGLLQGDPSSPILFNIYTNDIEKFFRSKGFRGIRIGVNNDVILLAYADDVVIFSESVIDLRDKLQTLQQYCEEKELTINVEKTKIMIFKKRINKTLYQTFKLNNSAIEIVDEFQYLGFKLHRNGIMMRELENRISNANFAFANLQSIVPSGKNTSWETKKTLMNSMVNSILLYGAEIWGVGCIENISSAQLKFFKRLLYLPLNTPGYAVINEARIQPIELQIIQRTLQWWMKLQNAPADSLIKQCYERLRSDEDDSNWVGRFKKLVFSPDLDGFWHNQNLQLNHRTCQEILSYHQNRLKMETNMRIAESTSLYWFKDLANYGNENYLNLDLPSSTINVYAQTRLLNKFNEKLYLNGTSYKFFNDQLCTICNFRKNDTLLHLLTECNITEPLRRHYMTHGSQEEFINLIKSNNVESVQKVVNFIKQSLRIRSFVLHE
jgi:hypothetical protein